MKRRLAVILGLASVLLPAKAFGGPIGYTAGFSISAVAGAPRQSFTSNLLTPVSSYEDSRTIFDTGTDNSGDAAWSGSATTTVEISASGGSIGVYAYLEAFDSLAAPDDIAAVGAGAFITMNVTYHDHWTAISPDIAAGTLVPFQATFPSNWTSTADLECGGSSGTLNVGYGDGSSMFLTVTKTTSIGSTSITGICDETTTELWLPIGVSVPVQLRYALVAQVVSANPTGAGVGEVSGLSLEWNDFNTFRLLFDPLQSGYSLFTESGNSFASPTGTPAPVPEPATLSLLGLGLAGVVARRRMKRR